MKPLTNAQKLAKIEALLREEDGTWREDVNGADFVQEVSLIIDAPVASAPVVSADSDANWLNNAIQFPRLIAELVAAGAFTQDVIGALCVSMDLEIENIHDLMDRAEAEWDRSKA